MKFRTNIPPDEIQKPKVLINYQSNIGLIGSCFVKNMAKKLSYYKFSNWFNPHGILFNPIAIEKSLSDIVRQKIYTDKELFYHDERWHSWHHHSDFSHPSISKTLSKINTSIEQSGKVLKNSSYLIFTLGTAWVYHHIETDQIVANCHKVPQKMFVKKILSAEEIAESLQNTIDLIRKSNARSTIMLTVSPVRHIKDGVLADNQSKAHLLTAIHKIASNNNDVYYFPSYEIVLDDLRDYRFFETDMVHPNQTAIDYVWGIFKDIWIDAKSFPLMEQVEQIQKGLQHKSFNPDSEKHQAFLSKLTQQVEQLYKKHGIRF